MPGVFYRVPSNTVRPSLTTLRLVVTKVAVHPSSNSFTIDTRELGCRWGKMCDFLAVGIRRGFRFRNTLWVACMSLLLGSITWGPFFIG